MSDDRAVSIVAELLDDPYGRWFVLVALIVVAVVVALLIYVTRRRKINAALDDIAGELKVVRHEVKNDHKTNLREEQDDRHDQNYRALNRIEQKVDQLAVAVGVHQYRLDDIDNDLGRTRDRRPEQ